MRRSRNATAADYIELRARSAFSFLEGASNPEDLVERAAELDYPALALADQDGVYGIPRFYKAAREAGLSSISGSCVRLESPSDQSVSLLLLVESRRGWQNLCRLLTAAHRGRAKGEARVSWEQIEEFSGDLIALLRADDTLTPALLDRTSAIFASSTAAQNRLWVDVSRHLDRNAEIATRRGVAMAENAGLPIVVTGDVRCARPHNRPLLDALTCLRFRTSLDTAGRLLLPNGERTLQERETMVQRFAQHPDWIRATRVIAERCAFDLKDLGYCFPEYPVPPGESQFSHLQHLAKKGAHQRYGAPLSPRVRNQLEHELRIIEKLGLEGYFLIVYDIVSFARQHDILVQGRGSAANSAVCYSLGITAVDPVGMDLLFERFLSEERGEWPDIDLDLPSGDQRERVIQYVFQKYKACGAAMTANVITYRTRMAVREMGKVLGMSAESVGRLSKHLGGLGHNDQLDDAGDILRQAGVDPRAPRMAHLLELVAQVRGLPRHLGQHSGGIVIAAGRLDEVVPIEPATMPGRSVVQWDKEDCADLGIIKIDLLGLGMLAALEQTLPLIRKHEGIEVDLAHLPADDPATYAMIQQADTIGTFQIESRAQMATLPRLKPTCFYDLVVEIAIIRPGPIVGQMVHPYLNRRAGREPITYPHPCLEPILERTLGVPLFQEQLLRIAMTAAGFSGGEAEELRRAMGFKRSVDKMKRIEVRLREGMRERGLSSEAQEETIRHITSFALYGFPESHSASFALIAYASAYLKCHHPAAFLVGLLNAYPMGFYNPATLVKDAQRHEVEVRPIDVVHSPWECTLESPGPAVRIGLRYASGLRNDAADRLVAERGHAPFRSLADLTKRVHLKRDELEVLAELGALASIPGAPERTQRRAALWQIAALERDPNSLFAGHAPHGRGFENANEPEAFPFAELSQTQTTLADYRLSGLTTGPQLLQHLRPELRERGLLSAEELRILPDGQTVGTAGHVIVCQRPLSAKGFTFLTLEDESGTSNAILTPGIFKRFRAPLHSSAVIEIAGVLQKVDGVLHIRVQKLSPLLQSREKLPARYAYR